MHLENKRHLNHHLLHLWLRMHSEILTACLLQSSHIKTSVEMANVDYIIEFSFALNFAHMYGKM